MRTRLVFLVAAAALLLLATDAAAIHIRAFKQFGLDTPKNPDPDAAQGSDLLFQKKDLSSFDAHCHL